MHDVAITPLVYIPCHLLTRPYYYYRSRNTKWTLSLSLLSWRSSDRLMSRSRDVIPLTALLVLLQCSGAFVERGTAREHMMAEGGIGMVVNL
jgi:hypothetical protein